MLSSISAFFERCLKSDSAGSTQNSTDRLHLACAALLVELGTADSSLAPEEKSTLMNILQNRFGLNESELDELWSLALAEKHEATDLYQFTSLINEHYGYEDKCTLLRHLWEVAYADGRIDRFEEHLIRRIGNLLHLTHGDFIRAKQAGRPT